MIQFIFDTDHVSLHERGHFPLRAKLTSIPSDAIGVSVITVEEMLRGRLAVLARRTAGEAQVRAYAKFMETVEFFSRIPVLPFDLGVSRNFRNCVPRGYVLGAGIFVSLPRLWSTMWCW